jgi:hypothetical protein
MRFVVAYLDPGTGSLVVQAVLGGVAGAVVLFKTMGRRMMKRGQAPAPSEEPAVEEPVVDNGPG